MPQHQQQKLLQRLKQHLLQKQLNSLLKPFGNNR
jgi:hypothetical protein